MTGAELRQLRERADLRQEQLAELIGREQPTVSRWEARGEEEVPPYAARLVALVLAELARVETGTDAA